MLSTSLEKPVETEEKKNKTDLSGNVFLFFFKPKAFIVNHSEMRSENQIYILIIMQIKDSF